METIYSWIRTVSTLLIVISLIKNLLPGRSYNAYFNSFLGMLVVYIICRPLSGDYSLEEIISDAIYSFDKDIGAVYSEEEMESFAYSLTASEYERVLRYEITSEAEAAGFDVSNVELILEDEGVEYGVVREVTITCSSYCTEDQIEDLCSRLSELLGIDKGCIFCQI